MPLTAAQADALRTANPDLLPSTEVRGQPELRYEDYGVGDPGPGRRWIIDEGALVLFDTRRGIQIYRKPIGEVVAPQVQEYEEEPPLRPTVPLTAKEPEDVTFQPQGDDLDFGEVPPPPTIIGELERERVYNPDGSFSTERSITVTDERINGGKPTNIPSMFEGVERDEEEAIERIVEAGGVDPETGRELPSFPSVEDAVAAAVARSDSLGMSEVSPSLIPRLGSIPGFPGLSRPFR